MSKGHEGGTWMNDDQKGSMKEAARQAEKEKPAETPEAPKPARSRIKRPDAQAAAKIDYILGCLEPAEAQRALAMVIAWYQPTGEAKA